MHWKNRLDHGKQILACAKYKEEISDELKSLVQYATLCCISHEDVKISVLNLLSDILTDKLYPRSAFIASVFPASFTSLEAQQ